MAIVDLNHRITADWTERCDNLQSPDSFVFVSDNHQNDTLNPASMEISVGDVYLLPGDNKTYLITDEGLTVRPRHSVVIYTKEKFALPYNMFGVVTGKGNYIFKGCFVSTGKIDPGFTGYLKIGFYNGGLSKIVLKKGDSFASVFFVSTEFTMPHPLQNYQLTPTPEAKPISRCTRIWNYISAHWVAFLAWAVITIPTALLNILQFIKLI